MPDAELTRLEALAAHLAPDGPPPALYLFSRSGFEDALLEARRDPGRVRLVGPEELC